MKDTTRQTVAALAGGLILAAGVGSGASGAWADDIPSAVAQPDDTSPRSLEVSSHGDRVAATVMSSCAVGSPCSEVPYPYPTLADTSSVRVHPGGRLVLRPGAPASSVEVQLTRTSSGGQVTARRTRAARDLSVAGRRWQFDLPRDFRGGRRAQITVRPATGGDVTFQVRLRVHTH